MLDILAVARADIVGNWGRLRAVARESGIPVTTLRDIITNPDPNPTLHNVEKLRAYYARREAPQSGEQRSVA